MQFTTLSVRAAEGGSVKCRPEWLSRSTLLLTRADAAVKTAAFLWRGILDDGIVPVCRPSMTPSGPEL
jgi:hypothetical protein